MPLHLHDSLSRSLLPVLPMDGETLRFYCCGPTVYGPAHIGNFRTFILQDVFRRVVEAGWIATRHVRNLTDVDDKTIRQSQAEGLSLGDFTRLWTERFHADCAALNLLAPHIEPSAVAHLPEQIGLAEKLITAGHAYQAPDGSVYFNVASFPAYGKLSRLAERSITTGTRLSSDEYERESAADFVLWKARRPEDGPNAWPSPWGMGRPGWHLECSAMAMKHLGESFDLHSGGVDLVFPHHENEIAQSEAATGKPFARHWFHIAHLLVDGGKMSKSLGNMHTLDDIQAMGFTAEELRYVLISGSYRQPLNFTTASLSAARKALARLRQFHAQTSQAAPGSIEQAGPFAPVLEALFQDLNTPEALGRLFTIIRRPGVAEEAHSASGFATVLQCLGLTLAQEEKSSDGAPEEILALAAARWEAKRTRDFAQADALRNSISKQGWRIEDTPSDYQLHPI